MKKKLFESAGGALWFDQESQTITDKAGTKIAWSDYHGITISDDYQMGLSTQDALMVSAALQILTSDELMKGGK